MLERYKKEYDKMKVSLWLLIIMFFVVGVLPDYFILNLIEICMVLYLAIYNMVFSIKVLKNTNKKALPIICLVIDAYYLLSIIIGFIIGIIIGVISYV